MYVDTSPAAIEHRAHEAMGLKHHEQLTQHQISFGKLGELQTKSQKKALRLALARLKAGQS